MADVEVRGLADAGICSAAARDHCTKQAVWLACQGGDRKRDECSGRTFFFFLTQDPAGVAKAMLRAHMRSAPKTKLISLYIFDAVARHAQEIARRNGAGFSARNRTADQLAADASAFLRAAQEPAAEVGIDCLRHAPPEQREKVLKVIDIWGRANTFSSKILQRIHDYADREGQGSKSPQVEPLGPPGLPANVLAMLGGAGAAPAAAGAAPASAAAPAAPAAAPVPPVPSAAPAAPAAVGQRSARGPPPGGWPPGGGSAQSRGPPPGGWPPGGGSAQSRSSPVQEKPVTEDLRAFDQSKFDPTRPDDWARLSKLWENTYKYEPTGPELMMALSTYWY